jgi:hypothetical protein
VIVPQESEPAAKAADVLSAEELEQLHEPLEGDEPADLAHVHLRRHETSRLRMPPRRVA